MGSTMRVSPKRRRRWNNILILGVIAFIALLNLPTVIKNYLIEDTEVSSAHPYLLNPHANLQALHFTDWSLEHIQGQWQSSVVLEVDEQELVHRWVSLAGTEVSQEKFNMLKGQLGMPRTIEIWYVDQSEPQRVTYYQTTNFWLLKNWQDKWIAISLEPRYLMPK